MNLARMVRPELIRLELQTVAPPEPEGDCDRERYVWSIKEAVIVELAELMAESGRVGNANRLRIDLINRERKATTGLAHGVAVPHVRTREAREFLIGFARSTPGVPFACLDGGLAHIFLVLIAPPYDDTLYLRIYKQIAEAFTFRDAGRTLQEAENEGEVLRALKDL
ncbi:MAG: PTS sugar transporter subunit IIA [Candidatus Eisenbacteria sp.]|nr:PTS sugar transporter subunit IIA [Candidatus Eisenbacteria bacterium]